MIRFYLLFIFGFFLCQCHTEAKKLALTGNIAFDLNNLMREGSVEVQVMDSVVRSAREQELSFRMQQATEKNSAWYNDYLLQYKQLRVPPYHENFGLTEHEYNELVQLKLNMILVPSFKQIIKVNKIQGMISFNTEGRIPYLDNLRINTVDNTIIADHYVLSFSDTVFVANENHALRSMWKGYTWRFDEPLAEDTISETSTIKHYSIAIGQLFKTGNTLISINEHESTDGEVNLNIDKPLILIND